MYTGSVLASASAILVYIQQASGTFASYLFFFFKRELFIVFFY